ncbi:MAG: type II toxin-antitoxin system RelE/ParE family toxin [Gammaproteobacteria bacterium]
MKNWKVFTKRQAEEDTNEIWSYIAQDNPLAAEAFLDAIEEASSILSTTPAIGSLRYFHHPELQGLRFYPLKKFEKYLVFYRTMEDAEVIEIVRIVHGARDLPRLFGRKENN